MNTAKVMTRGAVRPLTAKQQRFVLALLEGHGKSAAYRIAYGNNPDPHAVSAQAYRVANSPAVKAALSQAEKGNFAGLTICGVEAEILALKRISNDPTAAALCSAGGAASPNGAPPGKSST
jgi:hypothetical protein